MFIRIKTYKIAVVIPTRFFQKIDVLFPISSHDRFGGLTILSLECENVSDLPENKKKIKIISISKHSSKINKNFSLSALFALIV